MEDDGDRCTCISEMNHGREPCTRQRRSLAASLALVQTGASLISMHRPPRQASVCCCFHAPSPIPPSSASDAPSLRDSNPVTPSLYATALVLALRLPTDSLHCVSHPRSLAHPPHDNPWLLLRLLHSAGLDDRRRPHSSPSRPRTPQYFPPPSPAGSRSTAHEQRLTDRRARQDGDPPSGTARTRPPRPRQCPPAPRCEAHPEQQRQPHQNPGTHQGGRRQQQQRCCDPHLGRLPDRLRRLHRSDRGLHHHHAHD